MNDDKILVFVYGTLLSGEGNNYLLKTSKLLGEDKITGFNMHGTYAFPGLVETKTPVIEITGEVWEVNTPTFQRLDMLEGYPHFYDRKEVDTKFGGAWVYFCNKFSDQPVIESGSWKLHKKG